MQQAPPEKASDLTNDRDKEEVPSQRQAVAKTARWPLEVFKLRDGGTVTRLKSDFFHLCAFIAFIAGVWMLANGRQLGLLMILTLTPCLILYPLVRFLFGGKGGVVPVIATVVIEEVLKYKIEKAINKKPKK